MGDFEYRHGRRTPPPNTAGQRPEKPPMQQGNPRQTKESFNSRRSVFLRYFEIAMFHRNYTGAVSGRLSILSIFTMCCTLDYSKSFLPEFEMMNLLPSLEPSAKLFFFWLDEQCFGSGHLLNRTQAVSFGRVQNALVKSPYSKHGKC